MRGVLLPRGGGAYAPAQRELVVSAFAVRHGAELEGQLALERESFFGGIDREGGGLLEYGLGGERAVVDPRAPERRRAGGKDVVPRAVGERDARLWIDAEAQLVDADRAVGDE